MILINDNWEKVETIEDGLQIIKENLGKEFSETFACIILDTLNVDKRIAVAELENFISLEKMYIVANRKKRRGK